MQHDARCALNSLEKSVLLATVSVVGDPAIREKRLQRWTARLLGRPRGVVDAAGDKRIRQEDELSGAEAPALATCRFSSLVKRGDHWELQMDDVLLTTPTAGATSFKRLEGLLFDS